LPALFLRGLPAQLHFQRFELRQNRAIQPLLQLRTRRIAEVQLGDLALQIGDLPAHIRIIAELGAHFGQLAREIARHFLGGQRTRILALEHALGIVASVVVARIVGSAPVVAAIGAAARSKRTVAVSTVLVASGLVTARLVAALLVATLLVAALLVAALLVAL